MFKAFVVDHFEGKLLREIRNLFFEQLPQTGVTVKVEYSGLNYKDSLIVSGRKGLTNINPIVPGIDLAGEVIKSTDPNFSVGEKDFIIILIILFYHYYFNFYLFIIILI